MSSLRSSPRFLAVYNIVAALALAGCSSDPATPQPFAEIPEHDSVVAAPEGVSIEGVDVQVDADLSLNSTPSVDFVPSNLFSGAPDGLFVRGRVSSVRSLPGGWNPGALFIVRQAEVWAPPVSVRSIDPGSTLVSAEGGPSWTGEVDVVVRLDHEGKAPIFVARRAAKISQIM